MPMILQGQIVPLPSSNLPDGSNQNLLQGKSGEGIFAELHGKYLTQAYRGKLWNASITTASAIPAAATNATPNFIIWNPAGNTSAVVPVRLNVGFAAGTGIAGQIGYTYVPNAGTGIATAAAFSTLTAGPAIRSSIAGAAYLGNVLFGTAATGTGTAPYVPVRWRWSSLSQGAPITTTASAYTLFEDFDGSLILPPNTAFYLDATAAIAETMMISLVAYEIPWP
jgi:hypothetical protein